MIHNQVIKVVQIVQLSKSTLSPDEDLASVVQKVDNAIHWINLYPVDSAISFSHIYPLDSDLSAG